MAYDIIPTCTICGKILDGDDPVILEEMDGDEPTGEFFHVRCFEAKVDKDIEDCFRPPLQEPEGAACDKKKVKCYISPEWILSELMVQKFVERKYKISNAVWNKDFEVIEIEIDGDDFLELSYIPEISPICVVENGEKKLKSWGHSVSQVERQEPTIPKGDI